MINFDALSPIALAVLVVIVLSVSIELGYQAGKQLFKERDLNKHPLEASITNAILSLLAFMLAFTFGVSSSRYTTQREDGLAEAIIASSLYLRADLLPPSLAEKARPIIREYLEIRVTSFKAQDDQLILEAIKRSRQIQSELWTLAMKASASSREPERVNMFITTLNELIDIDAILQNHAFATRLPKILWYALLFLGLLATTMLGISSGLHGRRSRLASTALIIAFSVVIILIIDLDRPFHSLFKHGAPSREQALQEMKEKKSNASTLR